MAWRRAEPWPARPDREPAGWRRRGHTASTAAPQPHSRRGVLSRPAFIIIITITIRPGMEKGTANSGEGKKRRRPRRRDRIENKKLLHQHTARAIRRVAAMSRECMASGGGSALQASVVGRRARANRDAGQSA